MTLPALRSWRRTALAVLLALSGLLGCLQFFRAETVPARQERRFAGTVMGSAYTLVLAGDLSFDAAAAHEAASRTMARVDALMSTYRDDSDLARINRAEPGAWVPLSPETARVLQEARLVGEQSGGVYDVTVGPLVNLWGFGPERRPAFAPSDAEIQEARQCVGWEHLEVRPDPPSARRLKAGVFVDLSSIAQGFAVDDAAAALEALGATDYCLELSGEIRALGCNGRGLPWRIAIESPGQERRAAQRLVSVSGMALATSGDYRNYFEEAGVRYSHIIDPRTGYPVSHRLASVTVLDPSCTRADAWSTALLAAGPDTGFALAERENLAAYFIVRSRDGFEERLTPGFNHLTTK